MNQTHGSFKDKWENNQNSFYSDLMNPESEITQWVLRRNEFGTFEGFKKFLNTKSSILDAGCGNGRVTNLMASLTTNQITGIDFSSYNVAAQNLAHYPNVKIKQANLLENLEHVGTFDFIYCQEVLHHTGDARKSFVNLTRILNPNGEIAIYVYKKKAPVREFVDDLIRDKIKSMNYDEASKVCEGITELGKILSNLKQTITVPDIQVLGIKSGTYDVQRFIYNHFMKCFWNEGLSLQENNTINYDWYHPEDCTRHTMEEVREWFEDAKLKITKEHEDEYGITMWGQRA